MKIGIIATDSFHDIVDDLMKEGLDINTLTIKPELSLQSHQEIAEFMAGSRGYDLIHVIGSAVPVLYCRFLDVPMLVTICTDPTEMEKRIYMAAPVNCYFISAPGVQDVAGVDMLSVPDVSCVYAAQDYHRIYEHIDHLHSREDHRPWGFYEVISDECDNHKIKRITLWPKKRLSLQLHKKREEHWVVIAGQALVTLGDETVRLKPAGSIDIPRGVTHRVENTGDEPLVFIEVQQGDYFGEDDIIRLQDDFGRT